MFFFSLATAAAANPQSDASDERSAVSDDPHTDSYNPTPAE